MLGLVEELAILGEALVTGMVVMGSYDFLRIIRRIIKHKLYAITIEDFIFWVITGFYLFIQMYRTSDGSIRWYFVLGVSVGMIFFQWLFGKAIKLFAKMKKSIEKKRKTN